VVTHAERKGWAMDPAYVYADDGISAPEFATRPGFLFWLFLPCDGGIIEDPGAVSQTVLAVLAVRTARAATHAENVSTCPATSIESRSSCPRLTSNVLPGSSNLTEDAFEPFVPDPRAVTVTVSRWLPSRRLSCTERTARPFTRSVGVPTLVGARRFPNRSIGVNVT
jgi:hypothetical protein